MIQRRHWDLVLLAERARVDFGVCELIWRHCLDQFETAVCLLKYIDHQFNWRTVSTRWGEASEFVEIAVIRFSVVAYRVQYTHGDLDGAKAFLHVRIMRVSGR